MSFSRFDGFTDNSPRQNEGLEFLLREFEEKVRNHEGYVLYLKRNHFTTCVGMQDVEQKLHMARLDLRRALGLSSSTIQVPEGKKSQWKKHRTKNSSGNG